MLEVRKLSVSYGKTVGLHPLSLTLTHGVTAILGPNGAGKTSLLRALSTARRSAAGTLFYDGQAVHGRHAVCEYRRRLGLVPQESVPARHMRVSDFVGYAAWMREMPRAAVPDAVTAALEAVDMLERRTLKLGALSGGMVRRVVFAQALVNSPAVMLLDEPTSGLDPQQRAGLRSVVAQQGKGRVVVMSTHMADDVALVADRVLVFNTGHLLFDGPPQELASRGGGVDFATSLESGYLSVMSEDPAQP
jgi:ABC-type multidrug transport system ATPase subunit